MKTKHLRLVLKALSLAFVMTVSKSDAGDEALSTRDVMVGYRYIEKDGNQDSQKVCLNFYVGTYPSTNLLPSQRVTVDANCRSDGALLPDCPDCTVNSSNVYDLSKSHNFLPPHSADECQTSLSFMIKPTQNDQAIQVTCSAFQRQPQTTVIIYSKSGDHQTCNSKEDCKYRQQVCIQGVCVCQDDQFFVYNLRRCYQRITDVQKFCEVSEQCVDFAPETICSSGECQCSQKGYELQYKPHPFCVQTGSSRADKCIPDYTSFCCVSLLFIFRTIYAPLG